MHAKVGASCGPEVEGPVCSSWLNDTSFVGWSLVVVSSGVFVDSSSKCSVVPAWSGMEGSGAADVGTLPCPGFWEVCDAPRYLDLAGCNDTDSTLS